MAKRYAELQRIEGAREITAETDYEFWYHLEQALLLALREREKLNAMQYRYAEEQLKQQRIDRTKRLMGEGST